MNVSFYNETFSLYGVILTKKSWKEMYRAIIARTSYLQTKQPMARNAIRDVSLESNEEYELFPVTSAQHDYLQSCFALTSS